MIRTARRSVVAGALAGLGAIALMKSILWCTRGFQSGLAGLRVPEVAAYGGHSTAMVDLHALQRAWLLPLVVATGLAIAALVSRAAHHAVAGTDGVIASVNEGRTDKLTFRGAVVKLAATAATLGSGGSGGTEGPVAQVASSLDAEFARRIKLSRADPETRVLVLAGLASGVGALFRTPLGGTLLGVQILHGAVDLELLVPCAIASLSACLVFDLVLGFGPMLSHAGLGPFLRAADLFPLLALGVLCALLGRAYCFSLPYLERVLAPLRGSRRWFLPTAVGAGLLLGAAGVFVPEILGTGYGSVQDELSAQVLRAAPLWLLFLVPVGKLAATALTLNAGGVGGVFGPAMVIGGSAGALVWRCAEDLGLHPGPAPLYVVAGVAACLGPATRAATATTFIATGLVGAWVPPLDMIVAVLGARLLFGRAGLFPSQLTDEAYRRPDRYAIVRCIRTMASAGNGRKRGAQPPLVEQQVCLDSARSGEVGSG